MQPSRACRSWLAAVGTRVAVSLLPTRMRVCLQALFFFYFYDFNLIMLPLCLPTVPLPTVPVPVPVPVL